VRQPTEGGGDAPGRSCFQEQVALGLDPGDERIFRVRDVTRRACILSKPEPGYTEEARRNEVTGTVVLRAVLSSTRRVTDVKVVRGLPYGLTENALEAARRIAFVPAVKDGRYVSQHVVIEYNFNLY
jgi:TonB family protein